tara:strand:+ start:421 stop:2175 length:1755 start_codon:yes stop_codon:yes gene_type:complete
MRKPPKGKSLAVLNPELAKEWHPSMNGELTPFDVTTGTHKKVWWKCDKGDDHEWVATISKRNNGTNCPVCSNQKVVNSTCLSTTHPNLINYWHPTNNGELTPNDVVFGSTKRVWWKCDKGDDHEWIATVRSVAQFQTFCPICSGRVVEKSNCLATLNPELANQWHDTKNRELTPYDVTLNSNKKVWWKCDKGDDHEWYTDIAHRNNGRSCPVCLGQKVVKSNCLATLNPELANQWHDTKNRELTPYDVTLNSNKKVWWKCDKGDDHEWLATVSGRIKSGCSICVNQKVVKSNCLATTHPDVIKYWHPSKNGNLTPNDFVSGSEKKVWWKCEKGDDHEWLTTIYNVAELKTRCSVCINRTTVKSNSIGITHPKLANEWHASKNGSLTSFDVVVGSNKRVWWKCEKGDDHEWFSAPNTRLRKKTNCPYCTLTPQSKQELTITFELQSMFKDVNPKGFKTRIDGKLWTIDMYIPELHLGVEFDGSYWHKDKRALDKLKTEQLNEEGFHIIRVREEPLEKIFDKDVVSKLPYNGKQVTNDILSMIMSKFELDGKLVSKIKEYQSKDGLQNEKGLDKYIDKILTQKANN